MKQNVIVIEILVLQNITLNVYFIRRMMMSVNVLM